MNAEILSVVIPTHNRAQFLPQRLARVLPDQAVAEFIVVVDGCQDDTITLLQLNPSEKLTVLDNPEARGPEVARNMGAASATGAWIAFIDDDDELPGNFFQELLDRARQSGADLVAAPWLHVSLG